VHFLRYAGEQRASLEPKPYAGLAGIFGGKNAMPANWIDIIGAGLSGGFAVKFLDYLYQEYRRRSEVKKSAKDLVDRHIDPILKSADELVGKVRSLAQADFKELVRAPVPKDSSFDSWVPYMNILYLFAQFWSRIQTLRIESILVNLGTDERGKKLLEFFRALESVRTRLVERSWQRGMGEVLLEHGNGSIRTITYFEFVRQFLRSEEVQKWFQPLMSILVRMNHTRERQRLLVYGAILHAMIDSLDQSHLVTSERPGWSNKLSYRSKKDLKYRVFKVYLTFVKDPKRYYSAGV
jgi:hypothetical protein